MWEKKHYLLVSEPLSVLCLCKVSPPSMFCHMSLVQNFKYVSSTTATIYTVQSVWIFSVWVYELFFRFPLKIWEALVGWSFILPEQCLWNLLPFMLLLQAVLERAGYWSWLACPWLLGRVEQSQVCNRRKTSFEIMQLLLVHGVYLHKSFPVLYY